MRYNFPEIDPGRSHDINHYLDHVAEEVKEVKQETDKDKEAIEILDVLHAAETLVRKYFKSRPELNVYELIDQVIEKNRKRGYY